MGNEIYYNHDKRVHFIKKILLTSTYNLQLL
jgi:hypothetical protein